jgi:FlaA1/EpsC-like NDP-sugar epimerase
MKRLADLHFKRMHQVVLDTLVFLVSWIAAYVIRFEGIPAGPFAVYVRQMFVLLPFVILGQILLFYIFSVYSIIWRYISIRDAFGILKATAPLTAILAAFRFSVPSKLAMLRVPISVIFIDFLLVLLGTGAVRALRRIAFEDNVRGRLGLSDGTALKNVLLIGAGDAGNMILKELKHRTDLGMNPVGFVDDDPWKKGKHLQGVRILGDTSEIPAISEKKKIREAIITIANASSKDIRRIVDICEGAGLRVKIVPGLFEMLDEKIKITKVREINIEDLLGRSVFEMKKHLPEVAKAYRGKRILVTGAGGSIGSELCRQLSTLEPCEIILLDKDENSIFEIDSDLKDRELNCISIHPVIANIKNRDRLGLLFKQYRPEVVFHAAAHKHVPLMEFNIAEAILNNVMGTIHVAETAHRHNVERLVFISTDKAVNPSSIMGATKKLGEVIVQNIAKGSQVKFACVRFGNVLGSRGSVVPLFQKQISRGGPVTVTDPEMKRYFMSIPESVHLIIQAGTLGEKGEVFVLDMGQPIKIVEMVKTLIRLSGHREGDIEIKYIGARPGEKLYEEILKDEERSRSTKFEKIFIAPPDETSNENVLRKIDSIIEAAKVGDAAQIIQGLNEVEIGFRRKD